MVRRANWGGPKAFLSFFVIFLRCVLTLLFSLMAFIAASRQRALRSAPTYPVVCCASSAMSTLGQTGILAQRTVKMAFLCCTVGGPMITLRKQAQFSTSNTYRWSFVCTEFYVSTSLSNLPGLRSAGSKLSGRLVAPTTRKRSDWSTPSISVSSWATSRFSGAEELVLRGHRESSSSKNSTQGPSSAADRARSNTARSFSSLSPGRDPTTWNKQLHWPSTRLVWEDLPSVDPTSVL